MNVRGRERAIMQRGDEPVVAHGISLSVNGKRRGIPVGK